MMAPLPKKISPCPIFDATFELRFEPNLDSDAVFGLLYPKYSESYPKLEKLPVLELPQQIRDREAGLRFAPYYRLDSEEFQLQIGPRVLTLGVKGAYCGWESMSSEIRKVVDTLKAQGVVRSTLRASVRYMNFFPGANIFDQLQFVATVEPGIGDLTRNAFSIQTELHNDAGLCKLQIANHASVRKAGSEQKVGSIVDIDSIATSVTMENVLDQANEVHQKEKELFFSLLKPSYLESLNPVY